ncbi:MAG: hypothetical protein HWE10_04995 [Gammaproteobacteria bacterium]|nr:hypothetical protein [Gammaproteobacteria bacterium]
MTLGVAVTAGIEQTKVTSSSSRTKQAEVIDKASQIPSAAALSRANESNIEKANNQPTDPQIASEQIRVSVTTGESNIRGNLSKGQATEIYKQISQFL